MWLATDTHAIHYASLVEDHEDLVDYRNQRWPLNNGKDGSIFFQYALTRKRLDIMQPDGYRVSLIIEIYWNHSVFIHRSREEHILMQCYWHWQNSRRNLEGTGSLWLRNDRVTQQGTTQSSVQTLHCHVIHSAVKAIKFVNSKRYGREKRWRADLQYGSSRLCSALVLRLSSFHPFVTWPFNLLHTQERKFKIMPATLSCHNEDEERWDWQWSF
jgi:hypothetical protein